MRKEFPKTLTLITSVLTLAVMLGLGVQHWKSLQYIQGLKERHIPAAEVSTTIIHINDLLTDSATLAVLTGIDQWEDRYEKYAPAIDVATQKFASLLSEAMPTDKLVKLQNTRKVLFRMERQALDLGNKKLEQGFKILTSKKYQGLRTAYTNTIYDVLGRFSARRDAALEGHYRMARFTVAAFIFSLLFLVISWGYVLKVIREYEAHRKGMYAQLSQASKLTSLGTLSSGVAHELRNPLTVVKGLAQQLELEGGLSEETREMAKQIVEESGRIEAITDHLRSFAREGTGDKWEVLNVNEAISHSLTLLTQQLMNRNIELNLKLDPSVPKLKGNMGGLESVFQNLIANSRDAFELRDMKNREILVSTGLNAEGQIEVRVRDNAGGIPENVLPRLFDPFFTTKGGKGTGLGLSIVHGIIAKHRGTIRVENEPGAGVSFVMTFPQADLQTDSPSRQAA